MANVDLIFNSTFESNLDSKLQCYLNDSNQIYIEIFEDHGIDISEHKCIVLDKSTAIKLVKVLRTEISKI